MGPYILGSRSLIMRTLVKHGVRQPTRLLHRAETHPLPTEKHWVAPIRLESSAAGAPCFWVGELSILVHTFYFFVSPNIPHLSISSRSDKSQIFGYLRTPQHNSLRQSARPAQPQLPSIGRNLTSNASQSTCRNADRSSSPDPPGHKSSQLLSALCRAHTSLCASHNDHQPHRHSLRMCFHHTRQLLRTSPTLLRHNPLLRHSHRHTVLVAIVYRQNKQAGHGYPCPARLSTKPMPRAASGLRNYASSAVASPFAVR